MAEIEGGIRENTIGLIEQFAEIASTDPLVAAMLLSGAVLTAFAVTVFFALTAGAVVSSIRRVLSNPPAPDQPTR